MLTETYADLGNPRITSANHPQTSETCRAFNEKTHKQLSARDYYPNCYGCESKQTSAAKYDAAKARSVAVYSSLLTPPRPQKFCREMLEKACLASFMGDPNDLGTLTCGRADSNLPPLVGTATLKLLRNRFCRLLRLGKAKNGRPQLLCPTARNPNRRAASAAASTRGPL